MKNTVNEFGNAHFIDENNGPGLLDLIAAQANNIDSNPGDLQRIQKDIQRVSESIATDAAHVANLANEQANPISIDSEENPSPEFLFSIPGLKKFFDDQIGSNPTHLAPKSNIEVILPPEIAESPIFKENSHKGSESKFLH